MSLMLLRLQAYACGKAQRRLSLDRGKQESEGGKGGVEVVVFESEFHAVHHVRVDEFTISGPIGVRGDESAVGFDEIFAEVYR